MTPFYHHSPGVAVTSNRTLCIVIFRNDSSVAIMGEPRSLFLAGALSIQRESDKQPSRARHFIIWG